jgi:radical SAM superfamily enzyme YgiQ (UPF0313 family)
MIRILLVNPPLVPTGPIEPPAGLATLAAWLLHQGYDVRVLDLDLARRQHEARSSSEVESIFLDFLNRHSPTVVGFTSMYSNSLQADRLIKLTKHQMPEVMTLAGGSHFGALGREALARNYELDFVIQGEGETSLSEFIRQIEGSRNWFNVPSLIFRHNGEIKVNSPAPLIDLGNSPATWPLASQVIDPAAYLATQSDDFSKKIAYIEAGRGCPYHCSFCATAPFWDRKYRVKPASEIVEEMAFLNRYGYDRFILLHDLLTVDRRYISNLCDSILEARLPVKWMANSRTDINLDGLLAKMKAAGCWKLFFGIESGSPKIQQYCRKRLDLQVAYETIRDLSRHGITATCSFILGFASETVEDIDLSIAVGARLKMLGSETVQFHRLRLWPPAELASELVDVEFDETSAKIEYPYLDIMGDELAEIGADPKFFGGYFVPRSEIGSSAEIAQLEMLIHHAMSLAPLSLASMAQFYQGDLTLNILFSINSIGPISRKDLDWETGQLLKNWMTIEPYLKWLTENTPVGGSGREIVTHVLDYERERVLFVTGNDKNADTTLLASKARTKFGTRIDIPEVIRRITMGKSICPDVLGEFNVEFFREESGDYRSFIGRGSLG